MTARFIPTFYTNVLKYSYVGCEMDAIPISACLANSMHEQIGGTNISHANDNKPFNEYNGDDESQGDYPIVNNDDIQAFTSF